MKSDFPLNQSNDSPELPGALHHSDLGRRRKLKVGGQQSEEQDILKFLLDLTQKQEDLVRYETAYGPTYLMNNPGYIAHVLQSSNYPRISLLRIGLGEGLLSSEGEYWQRQRRLMQPSFHHQSIPKYQSQIIEATMAMLRRWETFANNGQPLEIAAEMLRLTLDIIFRVLFNDDMSARSTLLRESITPLLEDVGGFLRTAFGSSFSITASRNRRCQASLEEINRIVYEIIGEGRKRGRASGDLLSVLLQTDGNTGLTDLQVRDELVTLIFAGSETTSVMLAWTWYLLSEHRAVERRLHEELARDLDGRIPSIEELSLLKYTDMVLQESMRVYPPVWAIFRMALADDRVGDHDVVAGSRVVVSPYAMHHHPGYWEDPERFDPERFAPEASQSRPRYSFLPFGGGRHLCLGNHFAMMEGQIILSAVAQAYKLRLVTGHKVEPHPGLTLRMRHGLMMTLEPRQRP